MKKSFIERIFPHPPGSVLPQYENESPSPASTTSSPPRIQLRNSSPASEARPASRISLQATPLSDSIIHHDNPFLPVERAAHALQRTIQSFLDAQSDGLNASLSGAGTDDLSSVGSPTPTPSAVTPTRTNTGPKTIPVRQPAPKKITLRSARRGLSKCMEEFAQLKEKELHIITSEAANRQNALKKSRRFQDKKASLITEMEAIQAEDSAMNAANLRVEADKVHAEIQELETKLFELRARHRQLSLQAKQFENTVDSKLSSYKSSLALVEKDVKQFLRHPPVSSSLPLFDNMDSSHGGMYALRPDRRTLEMAQEQWTAEQELLSNRKADVEAEYEALQEGVKLWRDATRRISEFEKSLRGALREPSPQPNGSEEASNTDFRHSALLKRLNDLISSLQSDLATAESKSWNLLICCLGAEIEALEQGRLLLGGTPEAVSEGPVEGTTSHGAARSVDNESDPPDELLNGGVLGSPGSESNQSLEDTLKAFGEGSGAKGKEPVRSGFDGGPGIIGFGAPAIRSKTVESRDESEDDDPGPDFLLTHS